MSQLHVSSRSPIKKSWGEGAKIEKNHSVGRGVCQILKNMGEGGGGGGLPGQKNNIGCGVYITYTEKSQVGRQDIAI